MHAMSNVVPSSELGHRCERRDAEAKTKGTTPRTKPAKSLFTCNLSDEAKSAIDEMKIFYRNLTGEDVPNNVLLCRAIVALNMQLKENMLASALPVFVENEVATLNFITAGKPYACRRFDQDASADG